MRLRILLAAGVAALCSAPCLGAEPRIAPSNVTMDTMYQVCAFRQREILLHNKAAIDASMDFRNAKDPSVRAAKMQTFEASRQAALQAEESWNRLNCFELLFRSSLPNNR